MKQVINIPFGRYGHWYWGDKIFNDSKLYDLEKIDDGIVKRLRKKTLANKAQFIDGRVTEPYQCQCGTVLDVDKFFINAIKETAALNKKWRKREESKKRAVEINQIKGE